MTKRRTTKETFAPLTEDQLSELRAYASSNGRSWKSAIMLDWFNASLTGPLHQLRNTHGPAWLNEFRLPQA